MITMSEIRPSLTGEQAKQMRKRLRWSQARLAAEAHVSERTVRDFEAGVRHPQSGSLEAILGALGAAEGDPVSAREGWSEDVQLYLDVLGAYLTALPERQRLPEMQRIVRGIAERASQPS